MLSNLTGGSTSHVASAIHSTARKALSRPLRQPGTCRGFATTSPGKMITMSNAARREILKGCDILADTVGCTLGPKGRNVILEQSYGPPKITKDGVTVAKAIDLSKPLQNLGATLVKQVASSTNDSSGDGTTTATILARAIYKGGCEAVAAGLNPRDLLRGMQRATETVRKFLETKSRPVNASGDIYHVAKVSANGDETIGKLIAEAMEKVGQDGTITVTEGKRLEHELTVVEGFEFDQGFVSPYFMTDTRTHTCELQQNPYVLLCADKLVTVQSIVQILEEVLASSSELLIIADDFESELIAMLAVNRLRSGLKICAVKAPAFGENRKKQLDDLAVLTGGVVVSKEAGIKAQSLTLSQLGRVKRALISKDKTLLLEGNSNKKELRDRIESIKYQLNQTGASEYEKTKLKERLAKLSGGVAIVHVGGGSEIEVSEARDRIDDALNATRAAVAGGILPGGGTALLFAAAAALGNLKGNSMAEQTGISIIKKACEIPAKQIADNAGFEGAVVAANILRNHKFGEGFDANNGTYVDMYSQGILDPTKVVVTALQDAASVAALMATTEAAVHSMPSDRRKGCQTGGDDSAEYE